MIETIEIHPKENPKLKFPAAYRLNGSVQVVLFTSEKEGVVVHGDPQRRWEMGHGDCNWEPCGQTGIWTPVNLTILNPNAR